jgi:hypothetical protein
VIVPTGLYAIPAVGLRAGDGWLKTLPFWLPRLRRRQKIRRNIKPARRRIATIAPITIPAMAPPDSPFFFEAPVTEVGDAVEDADEDGEAVGVLLGNVIKAVIVGSTTPAHLCSAPEL